MTQLRIASINIERSKHLHRVEAFVRAYRPDVLCLQELCQRDVPFFEELMQGTLAYVPMVVSRSEQPSEPVGVGLVARSDSLQDITTGWYHGTPEEVATIHAGYGDNTTPNVLVAASYQGFRIATTHLNVTVHGESTPAQLASAARLVEVAQAQAQTHGGLLLCGDFNAPRGRPTFSLIHQAFEDGVPPHYTSSLDPDLHRAGPLPLMVDGLFHTPSYKLEDARLHTGISDHCALTCTLSKA